MIVVDFLDNDLLNKAIAGSEIVYNFAALADLDHARHKPVETINVNILGNWPAPENWSRCYVMIWVKNLLIRGG